MSGNEIILTAYDTVPMGRVSASLKSSVGADGRLGPRLGGRDHALRRLALELGRAHNDNSYQFSIVMMEFDGLSLAAHRLGDAFGIGVLQKVSDGLIKEIRPQDECCRLGGDEFLLIIPGKGEAECRNLLQRVGRCWRPIADRNDGHVQVSLGLVSSPAQGSTIQSLFAAADSAMRTVEPEALPALSLLLPAGDLAIAPVGPADSPRLLGMEYLAAWPRALVVKAKAGIVDATRAVMVALQWTQRPGAGA